MICISSLHVITQHRAKFFVVVTTIFLVASLVFPIGIFAQNNESKVPTERASSSFTYNLPSGWSFITLPLYNSSLITAEQLVDAIPCQYVRRWNSSAQYWEEHKKDTVENNFTLQNATGYFVWLDSKKDFTYQGEELIGTEINLFPGWNAIGWYDSNTTYPEKLLLGIENSTALGYWSNSLFRFINHPKGEEMSNFSITRGMGLLVHVKQNSVWNTLPIKSVEHDAPAILGPHEKFNVTIKGDAGYTATFDIEEIAAGVAMVEESSGIYKGDYSVSPSNPSGTYNITGHLSSAKGTASRNATTPITIDTTPPTISNVKAENINNTSATITWATDEASNSIVEYGTTQGSYPNSTWNATAVTAHSIKLIGLKPGTKYYYIVKSQDAAGNQVTSSEYNFTTTGQTFTLLLVDDDDGATYETNFRSALDANNYTYDYWNVKTSGSPSATQLSNYNIVIWFTSDDYNDALPTPGTLGADDRAALQSFLSTGGKLFITGQDIGYDANAGGWLAWYNTNLHANYIADDSGIANMDGIASDPISAGFTNIPGAGTLQDEITTYGSYSTKIFLYTGSSKIAGIKADNGTSGVVYIACMYFEGSDSAGNKATIMDRIIKWLILPPDLEPPVFAGLKYANNTIWIGTINLTWDPASDTSTPITYNIYIATTSGGQNFSKANYTTQNTQYKVSGLTNNVIYYFVVRARDNVGNVDNNTVEKSAKPTGTQPATKKYAVIVGISDYKAISDLSYCDEDANDWYYYLTNSKTSSTASEGNFAYALGETYDYIWVYGDSTSSYVKKDGVATEYNVKQALKSVVANATSSDLILFATSGHGSSSGSISYLCMWDSGAGESGEDGNLYDNELSAILKDALASRIFVFIDHCNSGHFCDELATMPNANKVFVTTTCTITGYGYDDTVSKNGLFTEWFLNKGLRNGQSGNATNQNMEANFKWVDDNYPEAGADNPQAFDGDTSKLFYLKG